MIPMGNPGRILMSRPKDSNWLRPQANDNLFVFPARIIHLWQVMGANNAPV